MPRDVPETPLVLDDNMSAGAAAQGDLCCVSEPSTLVSVAAPADTDSSPVLKSGSSTSTTERRQRQAQRHKSLEYDAASVLSRPVRQKKSESAEGSGVRVAVSAMQGWRRTMEDAHSVHVGCGVVMVGIFDGHCGPVVSNLAASMLPEEVMKTIPADSPPRELCFAMRDAFLSADERILSHIAGDPGGSTAVLFYRDVRNVMVVANAGDARCVLCRDGRALPLTLDHKPSMPTERQRVAAAGGEVVDGRVVVPAVGKLAVSRAFGDPAFKNAGQGRPVTAAPDVTVLSAHPEDEFVVLACDGIWDVMESAEVVEFVRHRLHSGDSISVITGQLCEACCADTLPGRGSDNMTVAIILFDQPQPLPAEKTALTTSVGLEREWCRVHREEMTLMQMPELPADDDRERSWLAGGMMVMHTVKQVTISEGSMQTFGQMMETMEASHCNVPDDDVDRRAAARCSPSTAWAGPVQPTVPNLLVPRAIPSIPSGTTAVSSRRASRLKQKGSPGGAGSAPSGSRSEGQLLGTEGTLTVSFGFLENNTQQSQNPLKVQTAVEPGSPLSNDASEDEPPQMSNGVLAPAVVSALGSLVLAVFFFAVGAVSAGIACTALCVLCSSVVAAAAAMDRLLPAKVDVALISAAVVHAVVSDALALGDCDGWALALPWVVCSQVSSSRPQAAGLLIVTVLWLVLRCVDEVEDLGILSAPGMSRDATKAIVGRLLVRLVSVAGCAAAAGGGRESLVRLLHTVNICAARFDLSSAEIAARGATSDVRHALEAVLETLRMYRKCEPVKRAALSSPAPGFFEPQANLPTTQVSPAGSRRTRSSIMSSHSVPFPRRPRTNASSPTSNDSSSPGNSPRLRLSEEQELDCSVMLMRCRTMSPGGMQRKSSSLLHAMLLLDRVDESDVTQAIGFFTSAAIESAKKCEGEVAFATGMQVCIGWNTFTACAAHAAQASICAFGIHQSLVPLDRGGLSRWYSMGLCSGTVVTGKTDTDVPHSVVVGSPVVFAQDLAYLAKHLFIRILMTEQVYTQVRSQIFARPVDVVTVTMVGTMSGIDSPEESSTKSVIVYELLGNRDSITQQAQEANWLYLAGFSAMRGMRWQEARTNLLEFLIAFPGDTQAQRILRLNCLLDSEDCDSPYTRRRIGWDDIEARAWSVSVDEEVRDATYVHRSVGDKDGCFHVASGTERKQHSVQHDVMLRRAIHEAEIEAHADQLAAWGIMPATPTGGPQVKKLPSRFMDFRGRWWQRAEKRLGRGAYGEVWMGMSSEGQLVAIKCMKLPQMGADSTTHSSARRRRRLAAGGTGGTGGGASGPDTYKAHLRQIEDLLSEVGLMQQLRHENVVLYLGSALVQSHVMIVMEYLSGGSLFTVMKEFAEKLPTTSVQRYMQDIVRGLAFLHSREIIHRDMKPHNVLLLIDGQCKLADFGASAKLSQLNMANQGVIGTPLYMAPEACRGRACKASDVWSLGIIVCQIFTGKLPFHFSEDDPFNPQAFMYKVGHDPHYRPVIPQEEIPPEASELVSRCLAANPADRPTAEEVLGHPFLLQ